MPLDENWPDLPEESPIVTRELDAIKFGVSQVLDPYWADRITVEKDPYIGMGMNVAYHFKANIWADKLADELQQVTKEVTTDVTVPVWISAWQLWKNNHRNSFLFGWINRRWPAKKQGEEDHFKKQRLTVEFNIKKYLTFPEFQPPPQRLGNYYRYVQATPGRMWWS